MFNLNLVCLLVSISAFAYSYRSLIVIFRGPDPDEVKADVYSVLMSTSFILCINFLVFSFLL